MHSLTLVVSLLVAGAEPAAAPTVDSVMAKSLVWLAEDSVRWREEHKCASCHHVPMMVWSFLEARQAGYAINEPLLDEMTKWLLTNSEARIIPDPQRKNAYYDGLEMGPVITSLAMSAMPAWDDAAREAWDKIAGHVIAKQKEDGSYPSGMGRPPVFQRPEGMTAFAVLALSPPEREKEKLRDVTAVRAKSLQWLADGPGNGSHQATVIRLLGLTRSGGSPETISRHVAELRKLQEANGGWRQIPELEPDAYATGQSLYVLRAAGVPADDPQIQRGVAFLVGTQTAEGNWPMRTRPNMDKPEDGFIKGTRPITYAASAWATLGIVRAAPKKQRGE